MRALETDVVDAVWAAVEPLLPTSVDEHPQPGRERGPRDVEGARELTEAAHPEERFAQDEQRPALADQLDLGCRTGCASGGS